MNHLKTTIIFKILFILASVFIVSCTKQKEKTTYEKMTDLIDNNRIVELMILIEKNSKLEFTNDYNRLSLLSYAVSKGRVKIINFLISNGANVNFRDINGITPLQLAIEKSITAKNKIKIIKLLTENGANVNVAEKIRLRTPLHIAVRKKNPEIVKILIQCGANLSAKDIFGKTPLDYSLSHNRKDISGLLIKNGGKTGKKFIR